MGGRFCSHDLTHLECESSLEEIMSFCSQTWVKFKKKRKKEGLHRKLKSFCPRNQVKTKKEKVFTAIRD